MIYINARFLSQSITGVQRYAIELSKRIKKLNGESITFLAPSNSIHHAIAKELNIKIVGKNTGFLWEQFDLPLYLKREGNPFLINFVGIGPAFYKNKLLFIYDLAFKHHPEWFSYSFRYVYNILIPISLRNSRHAVTDSNYVKEDIIRNYKINSNKIDVVYAAPSSGFINKNLDKEKFILMVSSIDPRKNMIRTIKAFNSVDSDYKLIIVGKKNNSFSKINLEDELLNDKITFTGYVDDKELINLYNKAGMFIYPSLLEGFGIPPLEAQTCGCPCIVSNTTSLPEVYLDSVEYCEPYSVESIRKSITLLINNKERRHELVEKGFQNVDRFSWDKSAEEFQKILEKVKGV
jgi:glycosyltransferase involved in cell wall biosynthesis